MNKYLLTRNFKGYINKADISKVGAGYLVSGSQNVLSTDKGTIAVRKGFTLDGAANSSANPIEASYDWNSHSGDELNLRAYSDELEVRISGTWTRILDSWASVSFRFAEYWDTNEGEDILLFVNGDGNVYAWAGGLAIISSTTANTITKTGTATWAEARFISNGSDYDKKVYINGTVYTYTGGEDTTTLTGVTPDPSGEANGSNVISSITTFADVPASGFNADLISAFNNQIWYGSTINRQVYVSKVNDFNDVAFASPRAVGEGALLTLDGAMVGFQPTEEAMYLTAGKDQWYKSKFTLSDDLTAESLEIERLKTAYQGAAQSQSLMTKIKNAVAFVSNEPTMDSLGDVENVPNPQQVPLSDPIKDEFDSATFTNGDMIYYRGKIYLALPSDHKVYIYDLEKRFWEPPQAMNIRRFAIIGGLLYGHSAEKPETYKLFDGYNDNDALINAVAKFSYQNYGDRFNTKSFDEFATEGYINVGTDVKLKIYYDFEGSTDIKEFNIDGGDTDILFQFTGDIKKGIRKKGTKPKAGEIGSASETPKFRQINTMPKLDFTEIQVQYSSNQLNPRFEIVAFGPNAKMSPNQPINIKK